ncbi:MAG: hypothetical protein AAGF99_05325 [Bacteroidota bacterium]
MYPYDADILLDLRDYYVSDQGLPLSFRAPARSGITSRISNDTLRLRPHEIRQHRVAVVATDSLGASRTDTLSLEALAHPLAGTYELVSVNDGQDALPYNVGGHRPGGMPEYVWLMEGTLRIDPLGKVVGGSTYQSSSSSAEPPALGGGNTSSTEGLFTGPAEFLFEGRPTPYRASLSGNVLSVVYLGNNKANQYVRTGIWPALTP